MCSLKKCEKKLSNRVGETAYNNQGLLMKIINYRNSNDIDIEFEDGTVVYNRSYNWFVRGKIKNYMNPEVLNIGYYGIDKINDNDTYIGKNGKKELLKTYIYDRWRNMLDRCYSNEQNSNYILYSECSVCDEWHSFYNYYIWFKQNMWGNNIAYQVDKDFLIKGNKIYSPTTCLLVDNKINSTIIKTNSKEKHYVGVYKLKNNKFYCRVRVKNKRISSNQFDSEIEAYNEYVRIKEAYIKELADEYKEKYHDFPDKLYNAMYSYRIRETDFIYDYSSYK